MRPQRMCKTWIYDLLSVHLLISLLSHLLLLCTLFGYTWPGHYVNNLLPAPFPTPNLFNKFLTVNVGTGREIDPHLSRGTIDKVLLLLLLQVMNTGSLVLTEISRVTF